MKPLDYTLYNRVKAKFPPQPGKIIFVSLKEDNLEELNGVCLGADEHEKLWTLARDHYSEAYPYATIGGYEDAEVTLDFCCREFEQEENLLTGEILKSSLGTYHNNPIDIEAVKKDLRKLQLGIWLEGNT